MRGGSSIPGVEIEVVDNPDEHRYEARGEGRVVGFASYRRRPGLLAFTHTEVDDGLAGHGIGGKLVAEALDDARRRGCAVLPFCPFVNRFIAEHRDYLELVPLEHRERFDLGRDPE